MANWHARDICGCLLLLLVFTGKRMDVANSGLTLAGGSLQVPPSFSYLVRTLLLKLKSQGARKWVAVSDISNSQTSQIVSGAQDPVIHQVARRLLTPAKPASRIPVLCQSPEQECEGGVGVTCMQGNVIGCNCEFIAVCYPQVSRCSRFNSTHTESCGF